MSMVAYYIVYFVVWIAAIVLSIWLAARRGRGWVGPFLLSFFLSWIGFILVALIFRRQTPVQVSEA